MKDVMNISEKATKILKLPNLKDKVICFVPEWERYQSEKIDANPENKEYLLNENFIFSFVKDQFFNDGIFSFLIFREFSNQDDKPTKKEIRDLEKELPWLKDFNKKVESMVGSVKKSDKLIDDNFRIFPNDAVAQALTSLRKIVEKKELHILCIDYSRLSQSILYNFIKYSDSWIFSNNPIISKEFRPLFKVFRKSSFDVQTVCFKEIEAIIDKVLNKSFSIEEMDRIDNLSVNHLQNTYIPAFWKSVEEKGYLCEYNKNELNFDGKKKKEDIRFFYSLESLLFWELKNCLKKIKRCENCTSILPDDYKGIYCPKRSKTFKECTKERSRKRQKANYYKAKNNNLTRI